MEEERKAAEKTRKEQYNGYVALAETNLKEQKYRDALKCVESARKVATDAESLRLTPLSVKSTRHQVPAHSLAQPMISLTART